jgi:NAD(P)H-dependent FMN reductase
MKIQIILGSTRPERKSEMIGRWVLEQAQARGDFEYELIDLRDWPLPFYNEVDSPNYLDGKFSTDLANKWGAKVAEAAGYIIITPEYNHGYPAVLKNALDYAYTEWNRKPAAFVSFGGSAAGARSVEQLRLVAAELQMAPVRTALAISMRAKPFDESGKLADESLNKRLAPVLDDLAWWTRALAVAKAVK